MKDPTYIAAYDPDRHVVRVDEAHFGPRPGFDGEVLASQLNKLSNCIAEGIHVTVEIQFRIVLKDTVDTGPGPSPSLRHLYTFDPTGRMPAIEQALKDHPEVDAFLVGLDALQAFMRTGCTLVPAGTDIAMLSALQYRTHDGRVRKFMSWDKCAPNEIWFVSWKLEEEEDKP